MLVISILERQRQKEPPRVCRLVSLAYLANSRPMSLAGGGGWTLLNKRQLRLLWPLPADKCIHTQVKATGQGGRLATVV